MQSPVHSSVVSFEEFEYVKENIQPVRKGRKVKALAKAFGSSNPEDKQLIEIERK